MLSKLAAHAEKGAVTARPLADTALRDQVKRLLSGWTLEDPNPGAYGMALQRMAGANPLFAVPQEGLHGAEDERLIQMSLEVDAVGPLIWRAVARLVDGGRFTTLLDLLEAAPPGSTAAEAIRAREATPDAVRRLFMETVVDLKTLDRLLERLGPAAAEALLDALAGAESRTTRRGVMDRLLRLGEAVSPVIVARLGEETRWFVVRNLLLLLDESSPPPRALPAGVSVLAWTAHEDPRVRLEAFKVAMKLPAEHDEALARALGDTDGRIVRRALLAAQRGCPDIAMPRVIALVASRRTAADARIQGIRILGATKRPGALQVLLSLTDGGKTLLGRPKLPPKTPELLAALSALATGWGRDEQATVVLARAAVSDDPEIRAATDPAPRS
jgi:hypothetical protein